MLSIPTCGVKVSGVMSPFSFSMAKGRFHRGHSRRLIVACFLWGSHSIWSVTSGGFTIRSRVPAHVAGKVDWPCAIQRAMLPTGQTRSIGNDEEKKALSRIYAVDGSWDFAHLIERLSHRRSHHRSRALALLVRRRYLDGIGGASNDACPVVVKAT